MKRESPPIYRGECQSWTEHISRKAGQWHPSARELTGQLEACGFRIPHVIQEEQTERGF